ncbi:hypothetical protein AWB69_07491 [Caballeronia udeis]|uniref:Uncharacterized protein n=1 Tax=Caballeronia udeis TaxID=1232866 RepID=A0A158JBM3_9BURK|nr:hypothetical protein AWB69_07491 [Caballeronia udeis]
MVLALIGRRSDDERMMRKVIIRRFDFLTSIGLIRHLPDVCAFAREKHRAGVRQPTKAGNSRAAKH